MFRASTWLCVIALLSAQNTAAHAAALLRRMYLCACMLMTSCMPCVCIHRGLGVPLMSCGTETLPVRKALTAGLFMNTAKLVDTAYDPRQPNSAGINTYRIVRSTGPGEVFSIAGCMEALPSPIVA